MHPQRPAIQAAAVLAVLALLTTGAPARSQEAVAPSPTVTQTEIEVLKSQIYALNKALRQLEVKMEDDQKAEDNEAKQLSVVSASGDGFTITSPDKAHQLRIGGRIGYDIAWFDQDEALKNALGDEQDGTGFRFARLRLQGTSWDNIAYQMEIDFAGETGADNAVFRDVFIELRGIPYGIGDGFTARAGHFREPFSLEELTAIPYRTFAERSLGNVLVPGRNAGIQVSDAWLGAPRKERLALTLGVFKTTDDWPSSNDSDEDQGYTLTGRLTGVPYYQEDGRKLIHLGLAYSKRNPDGAATGYSARPESRLSRLRYASTEALPPLYRLSTARAEDVDLFGAEAALVYGPFSLQGEYMLADVDTTFAGNRQFDAYYAQASWFLTGEHRPYRHAEGTFGRIVPKNNFGFKAKHGWGAWELTTRYSHLDLSDGPIPGGEHDSLTFGVNWYLNPNARITTNYMLNHVDHPLYDGDFSILQTRFQVEF